MRIFVSMCGKLEQTCEGQPDFKRKTKTFYSQSPLHFIVLLRTKSNYKVLAKFFKKTTFLIKFLQ